MGLPDEVVIGPLTYRVTTDRATINQAAVDSQLTFYANIRFGETDILIDDKQTPAHQRMTPLHEVLHGCFHVTMLDKKWEETAEWYRKQLEAQQARTAELERKLAGGS